MTKKHFEFVAKLISQVNDIQNRNNLAATAANTFESENPLFDRDRFLEACKVDFWSCPPEEIVIVC